MGSWVKENKLLRKIPLLIGYKESIYPLLHPPSYYKQQIMSQSTFPFSFFTCQTHIFPYLKWESTSLLTCIVEKSILEFSTAISAVLIADCLNRKKKNLKRKKGKKRKNPNNLPGLLKHDPAAKTPFRICTENHNHCCGSHKYPFWNSNILTYLPLTGHL